MSPEIKSRIIQYRTKDDFVQLMSNLKDPKVKNIAIIGGGFLGSELSSSLVRNRKFQLLKDNFFCFLIN
jgi:programmed cell death 8 (apoptosis-inducing factor)